MSSQVHNGMSKKINYKFSTYTRHIIIFIPIFKRKRKNIN